jgi:hypothetical protein
MAIFELIKLLIHGVEFAAKQAQKHQPERQLDPTLYTRRATSILQYIDIATNAMINDGKKEDEVKTILINMGLHEDHLDVVLDRAQRNYEKWFNETRSRPTLTSFEIYEQLAQSPRPIAKPLVDIVFEPGEDHSFHFCALINDKRYYHLNGRNLLYAAANQALKSAPIILNEDVAIRQSTFARWGGNANNPFLRVVTINDQREAIYPYLQTDIKYNFYPKQIIEWNNGHPVIEAEIDGSLDKDTPLCFFATDYAVNKQSYQSQSMIEVQLSAFVLALYKSGRNNNDIDQQPKGFKPSENFSNKSYFSFEGVILEIKGTAVDSLSIGCVMAVKFTHNQIPGKHLIINAYVSNDNIKTDKIHKGMLVTGRLWFQGEIASTKAALQPIRP